MILGADGCSETAELGRQSHVNHLHTRLATTTQARTATVRIQYVRENQPARARLSACSLYEQTDSAVFACCPVGPGYSFSGVSPNIFGGTIEAPKAPRGVGCGRGVPLPTTPSPEFFFSILDLKMAICGAFLVQFFCTSATTLEAAKSYSRPGIFLLGGQSPHSPLPPGSTPLYSFIALPRLAAVELNTL